MTTRTTLGIALLSTLCAAGSTAGQKPDMFCAGGMPMHGQMPMGNMPMGNMPMAAMPPMDQMMGPPAPAMMLEHKQELGLSGAQVRKLTALQKEMQPKCAGYMEAAMTAHRAANALLQGARPDFNAFSTKMKEAAAQMVEAHLVMARAADAARDILSAEQTNKLKMLMAKQHKRER